MKFVYYFFTISFFLLLCVSCNAQKNIAANVNKKEASSDKVLYVEYEILRQPRSFLLKISGRLIYRGGVSIFQYGNGKPGPVMQTAEDGSKGAYFQDKVGNVVYKNFIERSLTERMIFWMTPYLTKEEMPSMSWKIENETKKIGAYDARKAITTFRGREYTAWFTTQIPIGDGPWKFHGLPGLILEVSDADRMYAYTATQISYPYNAVNEGGNVVEIEIPQDGKLVGKAEFDRAYELEFVKMQKKILSQQGDRSGSMEVKMQAYNPQEISKN
jgi:GLPGLI family protein